MSSQVATHQTESYTVQTPVYEGPLDLLLDLIERAELDITTLALAQVTDQYLDYLRQLEHHDPAQVSAFLVIAARLVWIKSNALLPRPSKIDLPENEEDPGEALARQLIIYRRFKQLAQFLEERHNQGLRTYLRIGAPIPNLDPKLDLEGLTLSDFIQIARDVLTRSISTESLSSVVSMPRITIREKIHLILNNLKLMQTSTFSAMLNQRSRLEIVVTFLALLELVKRHVVQAQQVQLFGDISLEPLADWDDEAELEFGD